jgi:phosphoribosyl 1,2-cyclic phosphodiesterase
MGSGARPFGVHVLAKQARRPATVNIFQSHVHWDHIMGFPFFRAELRAEDEDPHPRLP